MVPKPERLWMLQIKQGVLVQSPWGLWGSTSPLVPPQPLPTCALAFSSLTSPDQSVCLAVGLPLLCSPTHTERGPAYREFPPLSPKVKAFNCTLSQNLLRNLSEPHHRSLRRSPGIRILTSLLSDPNSSGFVCESRICQRADTSLPSTCHLGTQHAYSHTHSHWLTLTTHTLAVQKATGHTVGIGYLCSVKSLNS